MATSSEHEKVVKAVAAVCTWRLAQHSCFVFSLVLADNHLHMQETCGVHVVNSIVEAERLCEQAVERWYERRTVAGEAAKCRTAEGALDEALERDVAARFAVRVLRDRCKTVVFPAQVNFIAGLTAFAIANTLKYK